MKHLITIFLAVICSASIFAQGTLEKSYRLASNETLSLEFEYPELIKISTWDKQEVLIKAKVLINNEDASEDFELSENRSSNQLTIKSKLRNKDKYSKNYISYSSDDDDESVTVNRKGTTITIGNGGKTYYNGTQIDIELEITLPKNAVAEIDAKYGLVEVLDAPKSLEVTAKYGGADIKIKEADLKTLRASTSWGQIFSNLTSKLSVVGNDMLGKRMTAEFDDVKGSNSVKVESEYGNVFLRKN